MNSVDRYIFESDIEFPTDFSTDSLEFSFLTDTEYVDINIEDAVTPSIFEAVDTEITEDEDFQSLLSATLQSSIINKVDSKNEETYINVTTDLEVKSPILPLNESPVKLDVVESELKKDIVVKSSLSKFIIKEEVKDTECHFVPNSHEYQTVETQNQNFTFSSVYNGNIADLVKTRKRTCNNKVRNTTNVNVKAKNRSANKRELTTNKNTAVKSATEVPLSLKRITPTNSSSQFPSFNVLKIKTEPEEYTEQFDTLKHVDSLDSQSLYDTASKLPKECQKQDPLPLWKSKTKSKKRKRHPENSSPLYTQTCFARLESSEMPSDLSVTYESINHLRDDQLFAPTVNIRSSPNENSVSKSSGQGDSPSLFKLRISRCANQFKSYVIPAEPIPVSQSPDRMKKRPKYSKEINKQISGNQNKHILDQRESKEEFISKTEKKKRKKDNERRSSRHKLKSNNQIFCDSKETVNKSQTLNSSPVKTESIKSNENIPITSVEGDSKIVNKSKVTEEQDVLNQKVTSFLQNDVPVCQPLDIKEAEILSNEKSEKEVRNHSFSKATKIIKKEKNACNVFEHKSLFNDQSYCDSSTVKKNQECETSLYNAESDELAKNVSVKKVKKVIDTYEYAEFEMHRSVNLPIDDFSFCSGYDVIFPITEFKETAEIAPVPKIKKEPIDTYEYSNFEMHQSVEVPFNNLNHICVSNDKAVDILQHKPKKPISIFSAGNIDTERNTVNNGCDFNKVAIKPRGNFYKRALGFDFVLTSNIESLSRSKQPEGIHCFESNSPDLLYTSKENLNSSPSTCGFDLPNEHTLHTFDSISSLKSTDSRGSLTSSQGTIINNANYFQIFETAVESNAEDVKELVKNDFPSSPPFSDCDEIVTNDSKSSPVTNTKQGFLEAKISDQGFFSNETDNDAETQRSSISPEVLGSKSKTIVHTSEHCSKVLEAKCTNLKAVNLKQCPEANDETTQSANSTFLLSTMQNSFHFQIRKKFSTEAPDQTINNNNNGKGNSSGDNTSEPSSLEHKEPPRSRPGVRQYRSRKLSKSSSSSGDSFYDSKTSKRVKKYHISRRNELLESSRKRSYSSKRHKSSSKSSYSESRSCSQYSFSSACDEYSKSPVESFLKKEKRKHHSSRSRSHRRRPHISSRSQSRSTRSRNTRSRNTRSRNTRSRSTRSRSTRSRSTRSRSTRSRSTRSRSTRSRSTRSRSTRSRSTRSRSTRSRSTRSRSTRSRSTRSRSTRSRSTRSRSTKSRSTKSRSTRSQSTRSRSTRSRNTRSRSGRNHSHHRSASSSKKDIEEQEKQMDERRVVYVGQIPDGFSTSELRERFSRFGRIEDINIHRKNSKRNNSFGFVTFKYTEDAYEAIAHGNDPPLKPKFDISFGGRRSFCRQRYSDLDKEKELMENNDYYYPPPKANDFDSLLNAELQRTGLQDKKY